MGFRCIFPVFAAAALLLSLPLSAADRTATTDDGLVPVEVNNVDEAWKRPGTSLKGYTSVMIRPVTVAFGKSWNPREYGMFGLKSDEVEHLRAELSKIASDTFGRVLSKGGYSLATAPGAIKVVPPKPAGPVSPLTFAPAKPPEDPATAAPTENPGSDSR